MSGDSFTIPYPRNVVLREVLRFLTRLALRLLTRVTITGKENLPANGPLILVGNHVALLEVLMMAMYVPYLIEIIGVGDIPLDPRFAFIINNYGYIPIKRGSVDSKGLNMALDVLKQGGVIGIFPEGGIWESGKGQARAGVAWLSHKGNAPVLPMGFGGMRGGLGAALKFKRPQLTMNIGQLIPPVQTDVPGKSRKQALEDGANELMARVEELVPAEEKAHWQSLDYEHFTFSISAFDHEGSALSIPPELAVQQPEALAKFFHRPVILSTMARNMKLPVQALQHYDTERDPAKIADATQAVLDFLHKNPQFLSYRFGYEEAAAMQAGLEKLRDTGSWAAAQEFTLAIQAVRRYQIAGQGGEIIEKTPAAHGI